MIQNSVPNTVLLRNGIPVHPEFTELLLRTVLGLAAYMVLLGSLASEAKEPI